MTARWHAALAYALIGRRLDLDEPGRPDPESLVAALAEAGWPAGRIEEHARALVAAEKSWPHQVPVVLRAECGAAQMAASLRLVRKLLGLAHLEVRPPSGRHTLNADEVRLMREVPPHHGS